MNFRRCLNCKLSLLLLMLMMLIVKHGAVVPTYTDEYPSPITPMAYGHQYDIGSNKTNLNMTNQLLIEEGEDPVSIYPWKTFLRNYRRKESIESKEFALIHTFFPRQSSRISKTLYQQFLKEFFTTDLATEAEPRPSAVSVGEGRATILATLISKYLAESELDHSQVHKTKYSLLNCYNDIYRGDFLDWLADFSSDL